MVRRTPADRTCIRYRLTAIPTAFSPSKDGVRRGRQHWHALGAGNSRESGLLIVELNLAQHWHSSAPQIYRHAPERASPTPTSALRAYRPGDHFVACYATACVT